MLNSSLKVSGLILLSMLLLQPVSRAADTAAKSTGPIQVPIQKISAAVFEVIVPKVEDDFIKYEKPIPFDKLPYSRRTDKFESIGTAFAIAPDKFVSAAHVFAIAANGQDGEFYIRDQAGKEYKVGRVLKLSTDRDLIEFEVKNGPKDLVPLEISTQSAVGDSVFVVGNALGDGISYRDGMLSSFTSEEVQNRWKFIRFSAPASPGNSGGPLINTSGQVVGVVQKKNSTENLNFAIPIAELEKVSDKQAEFVIRNLEFKRGSESVNKQWEFSTSLPSSLSSLTHDAENSLRKFELSIIDSLTSLKDERFPPANQKWKDYLLHPDDWSGLSSIAYNLNTKTWFLNRVNTRAVNFGEEEKYRAAKLGEHELVFIELKKGEKVKDLMSSGDKMLERVLKALGIGRKFLGESYKITSFGKPMDSDKFTDDLGRPWSFWTWQSGTLQQKLTLNCLPTPSGPLCGFSYVPLTDTLLARDEYYRKTLYNLMTSYEGTLTQWTEFLDLSDSILPEIFKKGAFKIEKDHGLQVKFQDHTVHLEQKDLGPESRIGFKLGYSTHEALALDIRSISVTPVFNGAVYQIFAFAEPLSSSPDKTKKKWDDLQKGQGSYDGKPHRDKEWTDVMHVLPNPESNEKPKRVFYTLCSSKSEKPDTAFFVACDDFTGNVKYLK